MIITIVVAEDGGGSGGLNGHVKRPVRGKRRKMPQIHRKMPYNDGYLCQQNMILRINMGTTP